jgi:anti-sigma B factor antagonist
VITPTAEVFVLDGEVDLHVVPKLDRELRALFAKKPKRVVVDLTKVTYLDSAGLALLIAAMQDARAVGCEFFLAAIRAEIQPIFHMACLDSLFRVFPDVRRAIAAS